jgi:hypothetical protein
MINEREDKVMKKFPISVIILFVVVAGFTFVAHSQSTKESQNIRIKDFGSFGIIPLPDKAELERMYAEQDSMMKVYNARVKNRKGTAKVATIPDWKSLMSDVEDQGASKSC